MTTRRKLLLGTLVVLTGLVGFALLRPKPPPNEVVSVPENLTVAAAPAPKTLPLLGVEGRDADGRPLKYIDQPGFRSLLLHRKFAELDRYFEQLQAEFEQDYRNEDWVGDAATAFYSSEPGLQAPLDAWVKASDSFGSRLARGTWAVSMAWVARGGGWAKDVSPEAWTATRAWLRRGTEDLERAIALRPTLVAAREELINAASTAGDEALRQQTFARAIDECPGCYQVRVTEIQARRPRWGGSLEQMAALAREAPVATNPRLKLLAGFPALDEAHGLLEEKKLPQALAKVEEALRAGQSPAFLGLRAQISAAQDRDDEALRDFDRALALRPTANWVRLERVRYHLKRQAFEAAAADLLTVLRVQSSAEAIRLWPSVVQGLTYTLDQLCTAGRIADAERVAELALELAADQKLVRQFHTRVTHLAVGDAGVDELYAKAVAAPADFRAHRLLGHRLYLEGRHPETIAMWTQFLQGNPDHGAALLERGGAYWQAAQSAPAIADAAAACALGTNAGCAIATELKRRVAAGVRW